MSLRTEQSEVKQSYLHQEMLRSLPFGRNDKFKESPNLLIVQYLEKSLLAPDFPTQIKR
ncbi:MAG: hypothetical protein ACKO3K_20375 [Cuspidothrix sp.]